MSPRVCVLAVLAGVWLIAAPAHAAGFDTGTFTEFTGGVAPGLTAGAAPSDAAPGPDGNVWFAEQSGAGGIARITPAGAVTELRGGVTPGFVDGGRPANLATGPDGNVWVTGFADPGRVWKATPAGAVTEVATGGSRPELPANAQLAGITAGPDGNLWFVGFADPGRIFKVTPGGTVTQVAVGGVTPGFSAGGRPRAITPGPDGNLWFTEFAGAGRIGRITPSGVVTEFTGGVTPGFSAATGPVDIVAGPDGNLWFTEQATDRIGRITPAGVVTEFGGLTAGREPGLLTAAPDGNLWFTEQGGPGGIGRITPAGVVAEYPAGTTPGFTAGRQPTGIAAGGDGNLWFTEYAGPGGVGRIAQVAGGPAGGPGSAPGGGSGPGAPGGGPLVPPAPRVTGVSAAAPIVAGRPALVSATVAGGADRLEWDVTGDGRTDVTCSGSQTTLGFRPPAGRTAVRQAGAARFDGRITVRAVGPGGTGPALTQALAVAPAQAVTADPKLVARVARVVDKAAPVYACGAAADLPAAKADLKIRTNDVDARFCLPRTITAGTLRIEGCLHPVRKLADIPQAEQGLVFLLYSVLGLRSTGGRITDRVSAKLGVAFDLTDSYVATGSVRINGVDVEPQAGAHIVVYSQANQVASSNAALSVGGISLKAERDFILDTTPVSGGRIPLGKFARLPSRIRGLGKFPLTGDVGVTLEPSVGGAPAGSRLTATLELPAFLSVGGGPAQARVSLRLNADGDLVVDDLHIGPLGADIGPLGASDVQLDYTGATDEWKGQAKLCVVVACLDAVERTGQVPPAGVVIRNGKLVRAFVNLSFPEPGIDLYPPYVRLNRIGAGLALDPTRLLGSATATVLGIYSVDGNVALAFPSAAAPYRLTREEAGDAFREGDYARAYTRFTLAASGVAYLKVPVLGARVRLGSAYLLYEAPGYVHVGGDVEESFFGIVKLRGRTSGEINVANGRFNFGQDIEACVLDFFCRGSATRLSSVGVGACATFNVGVGSISIGGGVRFSPFTVLPWPLDGCKWSRFEDPSVASSRAVTGASGGGGVTVTIQRGDPSRAIQLAGAAGAPNLRVTTPDGKVLESTPGPGTQLTAAVRILRSEQLKTTVVGLQDPSPGRYTIEALPGSPAITKVTTAEDPPDAKVTATVRGAGARRTLAYDVLPRPAQRVTFVETGPGGDRPIGTVAGGRGTLAFTPAPGGGVRHVEAHFELAGIGAERKVVARFTAPSGRLGRPARVAVRRRGVALRVQWPAVTGATRYEVVVTAATGGQRIVRTARRVLSVRGIDRRSGGRVTVRAMAPMRQGRARAASYRAVAPRAPTRLRKLPRVARRG